MITTYNHLWEPLVTFAEWIGMKVPRAEQNWLSLPGTHLWFDKDDQGLSKRPGHVKDVLAWIPQIETWFLTPDRKHFEG